jgi:hypothetical protein
MTKASQKEIMNKRAMNQLRISKDRKDMSTIDQTANTSLKLFHFHIEAFDDKISLNKMIADKEKKNLSLSLRNSNMTFHSSGTDTSPNS